MAKAKWIFLLILFVIALAITVQHDDVKQTEEVYVYVPDTDGGLIAIPFSHPDKEEYLAEMEAHFREVPTNTEAVQPGYQAVVPETVWVEVANTSPVIQLFSNGARQLAAGGHCLAEFGGFVTVMEIHGRDLLVEYTAPGNPVGTPCPSGVQFIVKSDITAMNEQYAVTRNAIRTERETIKRLLAQNYYGEPMRIAGRSWVSAVNLEPVAQYFSNGYGYLAYGEVCILGLGDGAIRSRGEENGMVLYEYRADGQQLGTSCPSGVLFLEKISNARTAAGDAPLNINLAAMAAEEAI